MVGKKGQKKRFWPDKEKCSICAQARTPGVSAAQVARRYAMNASLLHKWLRDPRFATEQEDVVLRTEEATAFLPVGIGA